MIPGRRVVTFRASNLLKNYVDRIEQSTTEGMNQRQEPSA